MTIETIKALLGADILFGVGLLKEEINAAFSSDMMSDVLAYASNHSALITGLNNPQVIRTAEMLDISCIVFVRNKMPCDSILDLAKGKHIAILRTGFGMFTTCGILYSNGLKGGVLLDHEQ
jgi:hypothetical protein